jgi:hypothetical protein
MSAGDGNGLDDITYKQCLTITYKHCLTITSKQVAGDGLDDGFKEEGDGNPRYVRVRVRG